MHTENNIMNNERATINNCGFSVSLLGEQKIRTIKIEWLGVAPL